MSQDKLSPDLVKEFVIAGHGNLPKVKSMLTEHPALLNASYPWTDKDCETAIQAASQVGSVAVAEYLLSQGAPLAIYTAAMMGRKSDVERLLRENPNNINMAGAHGIPLLAHAALSGNLDVVQLLYEKGCTQGVSFALHNAVRKNDLKTAKWLLENGKPDLSWKDYQGKTALTVAAENNHDDLVSLLRQHGATQ